MKLASFVDGEVSISGTVKFAIWDMKSKMAIMMNSLIAIANDVVIYSVIHY